jgi:dihydroflavonol-4-reductase
MQDKKFFITGGSGFIGSNILKQLVEDGHSCISLITDSADSNIHAECIHGNLLDPITYESHLTNVDTIVHAAGIVSFNRKDRNLLLRSNYLATKELVNLALFKGVKNLIYISSSSTLIRSVDPLCISLRTSGNPVFHSYYAKTKFLAELEIRRAEAEGMNICILYPGLVIGHWNWNQSSMQIFNLVKTGISCYPPGNLSVVACEDLARIVSWICRNGITTQQLLINAEVWTYRDFLNEIAECLNQKKIDSKAGYLKIKLLSLIQNMKSSRDNQRPILNKETIAIACSTFRFDDSSIGQIMPNDYLDIKRHIREIILQHSIQP